MYIFSWTTLFVDKSYNVRVLKYRNFVSFIKPLKVCPTPWDRAERCNKDVWILIC